MKTIVGKLEHLLGIIVDHNCIHVCTGEEWQKARKLQDKMKSNLENTRERLDELGMYI